MAIGIDVRLWKQTGIGRYIRNLVSELSKLDKKNQYALFARPEDIEDIKSAVSSQQFVVIPTDIKWHSVSEQVEFPRLLNKYNLDLMHFPYFSVPVFYKKPFVVTVHDLIINHFPTGKASTLPFPLYKVKRLGYGLVLKKAIHDAKKIIAPSNATRNEIINIYKTRKDKISVTPEGVDDTISDFKPVLFKPKNPYFLYVGNAYPHKNLERFLEAFKLFTVDNSRFTVKLVGRQDFFYKKLKGYVEKNKIQGVEFLGYVEDLDLANLYAQATATFIPSLMEGFGLTALEAMSMKSLVACSKIPSLEEVCGANAQYFNPEDILSITGAMEQIAGLSEKEKPELIKKAKKHAETFSWKTTAKLTLDVYNSCL
ncbi:MAG: glycosyltransferase family 4 protein [Candidatus Levyibacteriota bacterium]